MSYIPRPKASGDDLVSSRDPIRTNFTLLQDRFDENHVNLDGGSGGGKHSFLQMPVQASAPTTAASEGGLYVADDSGGAAQLFYREESNGTTNQLTGGTVAAQGSITLAGGTVMKWGVSSVISGSSPQTLAITFSDDTAAFANNLFSVQLTPSRASSSPGSTFGFWVSTTGFSTTGFTIVNNSGHSYAFRWLAIGN